MRTREHALILAGRSRTMGMACFAFAVLFSLYCWSPLLNAQWSIIDDHGIIEIIGARERLPFGELVTALGKTEIGEAGQSVRLRPSYFTLRFLEASLWGKKPYLWYATRITIATLFAVALTAICLNWAGPALTFGFIAFELSQKYWADIFARLGPAETYAVLGSCLIIAGVASAIRNRWSTLACVAIATGIVIAAGSKENFLILTALPVWMLASHRINLSVGLKALFMVVLVYCAWIALSILHAVASAGQDVYANDVSIWARAELLRAFFMRADVLIWLLGCLSLVLLSSQVRRSAAAQDGKSDVVSAELRRDALILVGLLAIFATQYVFYSGQWPEKAEGRYLFPGVVLRHIALFIWIAAAVRIIERSFGPARWRWAAAWFASACLILSVQHRLNANHKRSLLAVADTRTFTANIDVATRFLAAHPDAALILESHHVVDYEPVQSIAKFVRAAGLSNQIALRIEGYSSAEFLKQNDRLAFQLAQTLEKQQASGADNFVPLSAVAGGKDCLSLGLSGPPSITCQSGRRIWR